MATITHPLWCVTSARTRRSAFAIAVTLRRSSIRSQFLVPLSPQQLAMESDEVVGHERAEPELVVRGEILLDWFPIHAAVAVQVAPPAMP